MNGTASRGPSRENSQKSLTPFGLITGGITGGIQAIFKTAEKITVGETNEYGRKKLNGGRYIGNLVRGVAQGRGTWIHKDGRKFVGEFFNDEFDGEGIFLWPDGRMFEGQWHANQPLPGQAGRMCFTDGSTLNTEFSETQIEKYFDVEKYSDMMTMDQLKWIITQHCPQRFQVARWRCLYSITRHGRRLKTFFDRVETSPFCLMVFRDNNKKVFGAFTTEVWDPDRETHFGTGENFVFTLDPLKVYKWSEKNDFFQKVFPTSIGIGGGGSVAIEIDKNFRTGRSGPCQTFDSPMLSSTPEWQCWDFEVWGVLEEDGFDEKAIDKDKDGKEENKDGNEENKDGNEENKDGNEEKDRTPRVEQPVTRTTSASSSLPAQDSPVPKPSKTASNTSHGTKHRAGQAGSAVAWAGAGQAVASPTRPQADQNGSLATPTEAMNGEQFNSAGEQIADRSCCQIAELNLDSQLIKY
eukprot:g38878.t1